MTVKTLDDFRTTDLDGDYRRNPKTEHWCAKCQKDIKDFSTARVVHLVGGGGLILHPGDEDAFQAAVRADPRCNLAAADLGCHAIGPDCARKIGLEWSSPS